MNRQQLIDAAYAAEKKYNLPKGMLVAQLHQESSDGTNTYNPEGPVGVMQVQPATAKARGFDPNDPLAAIDGAGQIMRDNLAQSGGNVSKALELYYAGSPGGIGPRSKAYPGQVAAQWNDDDAFDAATNFNTPKTPAETSDDADFEKSVTLAPGQSPSPTPSSAPAAPAEDPLVSSLKEGMEKIAETTHSPYQVRRYVREAGYDPSTMKNLDEASATGHINFGTPFAPTQLEHNTENDLFAGIERGASDVTGTLRGFASYMDNRFPALAALDRSAGTIAPALDPQNLSADYNSSILARKAYDQNYGSFASGAGRLGAQVALTAPFFGLAGRAAAEVGAPGQFLGGTAGRASIDAAGNAIPGNILLRGASLSAAGTAYGAGGNALTSAASDEPLGQRMEEGAKVGAVFGPAVGALSSGGQAIVDRVAPGVDQATAALAQLARDKYGFNLTGDQITNSPLVRKVSAMMSLNPVNNNLARDTEQRAQFSGAVGQTFGANAPDGVLSPEVMSAAKKNIGATFDAVAARNPVHVDDTLLGDLGDIENRYSASVTGDEIKPIKNQIDNVLSAAKEGDTITGETYQRLTSKGSPLDLASNSANPNIRSAAIEIRGALDDALERSAEASGNGADIQVLRAARLAYKNMKTVEPLVSKSPDSMVSPALLNNRVSVAFKNRAYQGAGDLDELAQIGKKFLTPPSTSGTPEGIRAQRLLEGTSTGAAIAAAASGHLLGYPGLGDLAGLSIFAGKRAVGGVTNAILKRAMQSNIYKNQLLDGALNGDVSSSVNGLPPPLMLGGNRLLQQVAFPPPQPQQ
jgi:hypothetical protein